MRLKFLILLNLVILISTFSSCSSIDSLTQSKDQLEILKSIADDAKYGINKKTISKKYIDKLNLNLKDLNFWNPCKYQLQETNALLTEKEIKYLNEKFKNLKTNNLELNSPNIKSDYNTENLRITSITTPILFRNKSFAVYYSEQRYGGQMNLLKKENNKWIKYCSYLVWIE
jgi:hypothetical protein